MTDRTLVFSSLDPEARKARRNLRMLGALAAGAAIATVYLMSSAPVFAASSSSDLCKKYFQAQAYDRAAMNCAAAAQDDDTGSQTALGWMYLHGKGLPKNHNEAARWINAAAEEGNIAAAALLGGMYLKGEAVAQDSEEAGKWLGIAAEAGHKGAQVALGTLYVDNEPDQLAKASAGSTAGSSGEAGHAIVAEPRTVSQAAAQPDPEKAVKWYKKAAKNGSPAGQAALGEAYRIGMGVEQNDVAAYMWYTLAADQGSRAAADAREIVAERMKPKQIAKAEAKARDWQADNSDKLRLQTSSSDN